MKNLLCLIMIVLVNQSYSQEYSAVYRLTFVGEWSSTSHPNDYPNNAHFSQLIGNTHNDEGGIWSPGELATMGIQFMAETGSVFNLTNEINDLISAGSAEVRLLGSGINAQSSTMFEFTITESHPLVSITTMIAPSPDWFIGVHDVNMQSAGQWQEELIFDLYPYDAGTDGGATFESADVLTIPPDPIALITTHPFTDNIPLGTLVFTRLSTTGTPTDDIFGSNFDGTN